MMAYHVLMTKCKQRLRGEEALRFPLALEPEASSAFSSLDSSSRGQEKAQNGGEERGAAQPVERRPETSASPGSSEDFHMFFARFRGVSRLCGRVFVARGVVSSAVCLLELCGLETEKLWVDVEAAKRIYHGAAVDAASVIELFMSFPDTEALRNRPSWLCGLVYIDYKWYTNYISCNYWK